MKFVNDEEIRKAAMDLILDVIRNTEDTSAALYTVYGVATLAGELTSEEGKE